MALKLPYLDEQTGAHFPAAYWRVFHYVDRGPKEGARIVMEPYADGHARQSGKAPLADGRREEVAKNWVEHRPAERPTFASVVGSDEPALASLRVADLEGLAGSNPVSLSTHLRQTKEYAADETLTERLRTLVATAKDIVARPPIAIPHNDYDAFFGDAVFLKGGTTPMKQAYAYLKTLPEWAGAVDA
jgi:hypothetical protein